MGADAITRFTSRVGDSWDHMTSKSGARKLKALRTAATTESYSPTQETVNPSVSLPSGWALARVDEIATLINGYAFTPRHWKPAGLPIVRIQNLNDPEATFNYCSDDLPDKFRITTGELLFAWSGTPGTSFGAHIWQGGDAWLNQHIFKVVFDRALVDVRFFQLALNHNLQEYVADAQGGSGLAHITKSAFGASRILIAPHDEQRRLIAEVDRLLGELDGGIRALERTQAQLDRYRSDIVDAALSGALTKGWRSRQAGIEPASRLVGRAQDEYQRIWQKEQKSRAGKSRSSTSFVGPSPVATSELSVLPKTWCWTTLETIAEVVGGVTKDQKKAHHPGVREVPYLRVANVQRGFLDLTDIKTIAASEDTINDLRLEVGDVLFTEGGDRDKLGRGWTWNGQLPECIHQNHVFRARLYTEDIQPALVSHHGNTFGQEWFKQAGKQTTNLASISLSVLRRFPVPLAPAAEQRQIVTALEERLFQIDAGEKAVREGVLRANELRRQILLDAFAGKLVSRNSTDAPVGVLLDGLRRYQAELCSRPRAKRQSSSKPQLDRGGQIMPLDTRRPLLAVLKEHPKGMSPEELLREAGYSLDDIDEFYKALRSVASRVEEKRPQPRTVRAWPHAARIRLHLKRT